MWHTTHPMQNSSDTVEIGYISKAHGIKGEVFLRLYAGRAEWTEPTLQIELLLKSGSKLTYSVSSQKPHQEGLIVKFEEVPDRNRAEELVGSKAFLPANFFVAASGEKPFLRELLGFEVHSECGEKIGKVKGFADSGKQQIIEIKKEKGSFLAPFVDQMIVNIDYEKKIIVMNLPEGLDEL